MRLWFALVFSLSGGFGCGGILPTSAAASSSASDAPPPSNSLPLYTSRFTSRPISDDLLHFVENCESSISCAGVSLDPNGTIAGGSKLYRHSFVGPYRTPKTYETRRKDFTYHRGEVRISSGGEEALEVRDDVTVAGAKGRCRSLPECVAFTYPVRSPVNLDRPANVTFVSEVREFVPSRSDEWRTYVSNGRSRDGTRIRDPDQLRFDPRVAENPYRTCCDREDVPAMREVMKVDTLERISCDISREEFFLQYELPRKPVMLTGCGKDWPAVLEQKWLPRNLAPRFSNQTRWRARIGGEKKLQSEDYNHNVRWGDIAEAMRTGKPYYLFDQLYDPEAKSIDDDYDDPLPVRGGDLYRKLPYFSGPLRWFCVGPPGTGTQSHMDPYGTDAWNTLIKGHKWWIIYPEGFTDESQLECDESCSVKVPLTSHWYASVGVNAARSEYAAPDGYGRHVLQRPGETIYVPDGLLHSVYNYDEAVAITRNYASAANLDEVWMETVTSGDPLKWRTMYFHTLNREQRRRVRRSKYWPPQRWEGREEEEECVADGEDEMIFFPMRGERDPAWTPRPGELVEASYSNGGEGEGYEEYWTMAKVLRVEDKTADVEFLDYVPNEGRFYHFKFLRPLPKEGDVVEAQYEGSHNEWYRATVSKVRDDGTWDVLYGDGEEDVGLTRDSIREFVPFEGGEMVQMLWKEDGEEYWVDAVVVASRDGKLDVKHFDGEVVEGVTAAELRRVRWEFEKGDDVAVLMDEDGEDEWFKGRVIKVRKNGRYDIMMDYGDLEDCTSWRSIRFQWAMADGWDEEDEEEEEEAH